LGARPFGGTGTTARAPLRADHAFELEKLLKLIDKVRPLCEARCSIASTVVGGSSKLLGFLTGAGNEIREILQADVLAERDRFHAAMSKRAV
jgi:hypothetical protein